MTVPNVPAPPQVVDGDLFESRAQTWVNTVNTVGVMGKGVALGFKKRFPEMYEDYVRRCRHGQVRLGRPYLFRPLVEPWILNFPTKDHWRSMSRLSDIVEGAEFLKSHYREWGIASLAVPPLGCGNGGLEWRVVGPALYRILSTFDIPVEMYAPHGTAAEQLDPEFLAASGAEQPESVGTRMRPAWVALVEIIRRLEAQRYHWPIGRVTFQKIAYFATEAGVPTDLEFARGSYGPFAPGLRSVESRLMNHGLLRATHMGSMVELSVGPTFADAAPVFADRLEEWGPLLDRVEDLFLRMRTQDAEVAATVHFAAHRLLDRPENATERDVLEAVRAWKQKRRPPLEESEIALAIRNLNLLGWIRVQPSQDLPIPTTAIAA